MYVLKILNAENLIVFATHFGSINNEYEVVF